jgi:multidrug efflux pump subunit AcrB
LPENPNVFSRFFIDRPIFASVLSIFVTLAGSVAYFSLPLAQFPSVTPPTIQVDCTYPGASAFAVAETVAAPIEQEVNGVERMLYMSSQSSNDGSYSLTVAFEQGVNLNLAQVMVQNRVNLAMPKLPDVVKQTGLTTRKKSPDILQIVNVFSHDTTKPPDELGLYLSNYAVMQVKDEIARVEGVGDIFVFGQRDYSMRIWIDAEKLAARNLSASDVANAIREQNAPVALGQIGQPPTSAGQQVQYTLSAVGRLTDIKEFENIILKSTPDGRMVRLREVARVELNAKDFSITAKTDKRPSAGLVIFQLPDANALETADRIIAKMEELKKGFPPGVDYQISYETTSYTEESINEVYKTLFDAVILVAAVVLLFLQNWRSALIPLLAVPVAIIGTFAVMAVMGFSLNTLTLFGLVLAIGIVVDDAIVVVEAVEHHLEHGLTPRDATVRAMEQVAGPVIAVGLVLSAVFVPCAFISGLTGQFFRQFALTIASSTVLSAFNSLTLSPALAALLLRPRSAENDEALPRWGFLLLGGCFGWLWLGPKLAHLPGQFDEGFQEQVDGYLKALPAHSLNALSAIIIAAAAWYWGRALNRGLLAGFRLFHRGFTYSIHGYSFVVGGMLRLSFLVLAVYAGLLCLTVWGFTQLPRGFIPQQDMGYLIMGVQLPDSASDERTRKVMDEVEGIVKSYPGIRHTSAISGQSFALGANGSNFGSLFVLLDKFEGRQSPELFSSAIMEGLKQRFAAEVSDGTCVVFPPPPIRGVGRAGGFKFMVEDRGDVGINMLYEETQNVIKRGNSLKVKKGGTFPWSESQDANVLAGLFTVSRINVPQLYFDLDVQECTVHAVPYQSVVDTLQIYLGSLYVNDFNLFGRTWQVVTQAEHRFRQDPDKVAKLQVRNALGNMVQLGTMAKVKPINGPLVLYRYNMYPAIPINGGAAPGISTGQANDAMKSLARDMPRSVSYEWTEMAFLEEIAGNTAMGLFGLAVVMVFLVLAAQYESWTLPLAVILVVPMCLLSAITGVWIAHMDINIFTQIGFVVLVGLASKNAILIVEYAKQQRASGASPYDATLEACKLRLRPIIMTSFAFILGVVPLLITHGAGAEMRRTLGTAVFAGMLGVTLFGIFLTPVFFYVIDVMGESEVFQSPRLRAFSHTVQVCLHWILIVATLGVPLLVSSRSNGGSDKPGNGN